MKVSNVRRPYTPGQSVPQTTDEVRRFLATELQRIADAFEVVGQGTAYAGNGAPAFAAPIGSTYQRRDGGAGTSFYVNEDGTDAGWVPK